MKLALISDTHGELPDPELFEDADAIIHAGDIGPDMDVKAWIRNVWEPWVGKVEAPVYATFGNHDFPAKWGMVDNQIYADTYAVIGGHKIWFSPWSPRFYNWAWMKSEPELSEIYRKIPDDINIIISHSPPYQCCDQNIEGEHCGSKALRVRMQELPNLRYLICGHIHEAYGMKMLGETTILNVASVNERYEPRVDQIVWLEI